MTSRNRKSTRNTEQVRPLAASAANPKKHGVGTNTVAGQKQA
jgi:hypothetical protein